MSSIKVVDPKEGESGNGGRSVVVLDGRMVDLTSGGLLSAGVDLMTGAGGLTAGWGAGERATDVKGSDAISGRSLFIRNGGRSLIGFGVDSDSPKQSSSLLPERSKEI
jgi:hypothetical protein